MRSVSSHGRASERERERERYRETEHRIDILESAASDREKDGVVIGSVKLSN